MQDILTCAMGLDVHRDIIVACLVKGAVDAEPEAETRTFQYAHPRNAETTGLGHRIRMSEHCHGKHRNLLAAYLRDAGILF